MKQLKNAGFITVTIFLIFFTACGDGGSKTPPTPKPEMVITPTVTGMTQSAAESAITSAGLRVGSSSTENSSTVLAGRVISQSPVGGSSVTKGSTVNLRVSLGPVQVHVPDVVNQSYEDAVSAIIQVSLKEGERSYEAHDTVLSGSVIRQNPEAGILVDEGTAVDLIMSSGPLLLKVETPNVVGKMEAEARAVIAAADLVVTSVTYENSSTVSYGIVISQTPKAGISVDIGTMVTLVVSSGPSGTQPPSQSVDTPDVVGKTESVAKSMIKSAGLSVGFVTYENSNTVSSGIVIRQTPEAKTPAGRGTSVTLVVSSNPADPFEAEMVHVEGGTFWMGCASSEQGTNCYPYEIPAHTVTVSSYYMGKFEVTQAQWKAVMGASDNPSAFKGDNLPVENVSWDDIQTFLQKLNDLTGKNYRLPTEAEWEYAARGGRNSEGSKYSGSNDAGTVAWYADNSGNKSHPVGSKATNELGIHDMSGNVWEWVKDWYEDYSSRPQTNPQGPNSGEYRVGRGGSWSKEAFHTQVARRNGGLPSNRATDLGFRIARSLD